MFKSTKKVLALLLTAALVLTMAFSAFAASSPVKPKKPVNATNVKTAYGSTANTHDYGEAALVKYNAKNVSTATAAVTKETVTVKGVVYRLVAINANAFKPAAKATSITLGKNIRRVKVSAFSGNVKNLKTIIVKNTNMVTFEKGAFKGFGKNTTKLTIRINSKNKKFAAIQTMLRKNGFKGKIVKANV